MSIMLAATDMGIGTGHSGVSDQELAREILGFPPARFCAWLSGLGYPADRQLRPINNPSRRPLDNVVHREGWEGAPSQRVESMSEEERKK